MHRGEGIFSTGLVLQERLQWFRGPQDEEAIVSRFAALPFIEPTPADHIAAAELRNTCRRCGVQAGTIDALLARLCIAHGLVMLSTDRYFAGIAEWTPPNLWR